jgi:hypothetical protein
MKDAPPFVKKSEKRSCAERKFWQTLPMFVIKHKFAPTFLGRLGWGSKSFARRFRTQEEAEAFISDCGDSLEGASVEIA